MTFLNRQEAGRRLAAKLAPYRTDEMVIYALPRGGVVVGYELASILQLPLDLVITRKVGHPDNPEYALGALTEKGNFVGNEIEAAFVNQEWLEQEINRQRQEVRRRRKMYFGDYPHLPAGGKVAVIVDDGVATGLTLLAAVRSIRKEEPKKIIVAIPVAPHEFVNFLHQEVEEIIILEDDDNYRGSVSEYYQEFAQITDDEVIDLWHKSLKRKVVDK